MAAPAFKKGKEVGIPLADMSRYQEAARKKLVQTGSKGQAERYANHVTKAAIQRRKRKPKPGES